ncbi:MAG: hypothetical protein ACE5GN_00525, partial [Waddliaceae bacterium]
MDKQPSSPGLSGTSPYNIPELDRLGKLFKAGAVHEECGNKTRSTRTDFFNRFEILWVFVYNKNVEPTNNAAEQRLKGGVVWRKLCYGSRSEVGERFMIPESFIESWHNNARWKTLAMV